MVAVRLLPIAILFFCAHAFASSVPTSVTYQGKIVKPDTNPLEDASVDFNVQILNPAGTCILFEEDFTSIDMTGSGGLFSLNLGTGTRSDGQAHTFIQVFENNRVFPSTGACGPGYTPLSEDHRQVRLEFNDGAPVVVTPNAEIAAVPYAFYAQSLQGMTAAEFLQVNTGGANTLSQANLEGVFSTPNYTELLALLAGTSTNYMQTSPGADVSFNNNKITDVTDPTNAQDAATKNYADTSIGGTDAAITGVTGAAGDGRVLSWNQAAARWEAVDLGAGNVVNTPAGDVAATDVQAAINELDTEKLALAGGTMSGDIDMGGNNIVNSGYITMNDDNYLHLGRYDDTAEAALVATPLGAAHEGVMWWDEEDNTIEYWDGSGVVVVGSGGGGGGGTLDESYDDGGAGAGRAVTVDTGAIQFTGSNAADETLEVTTSGNGGALFVENAGTGLSLRVNDEAADATPFVINAFGNVGVGTASPVASLEVESTGTSLVLDNPSGDTSMQIRRNGAIFSDINQRSGFVDFIARANDTGLNLGTTRDDGTTITYRIAMTGGVDTANVNVNDSNFNVNSNQFYVRESDGNVGVGIGAPGGKLHVSGGELILDGTGAYLDYKPNNVKCADGEVLKWDDGNDRWDCGTDTAGGGAGTLDASYDVGGAGAGRAITVDTGAVQLTGSNAADETLEVTNSGNGGVALFENAGTGLSLRVNDEAADATPFVIDASGSVGVGTSSPSNKLEVVGDIRLSGGNRTVRVDSTALTLMGTDGNSQIEIGAGSGTTYQAYDHTFNESGVGQIMVLNNGRVGIGATVGMMSSQLEVHSRAATGLNSTATDQDAIYLANPNSVVGQGNYGSSIGFNANGAVNYTHRQAAIASVQTGTVAPQVGLAFLTHPTTTQGDDLVESFRITHDGSLGVGTTTPDASALIDLSSTTKGLLPPRMSETNRDNISSPAEGLVVYNTTDDKLNVYDGGAWTEVGAGGTFGTGNSGFVGSLRYPTVAGCTWQSTSASFANFGTDSDCSAPTLGGAAAAPGVTKTPAIRFASLPAGLYRVSVTGGVFYASGAATPCNFAISDGTTRLGSVWAYSDASQAAGALIADFEYSSSQTNLEFNVQAMRETGAGACQLYSSGFDRKLTLSVTRIDGNTQAVQLADDDGDTGVNSEASSDEDILRFRTAGTERMNIDASGNINISGGLVATGTVDLTGATITDDSITIDDLDFGSSTAGLNIPSLAAEPTGSADGQMYYNTTSNKLFVYDSGTTTWSEVGSDSFGSISCPAGFTNLTAAGKSLGCIQDAIEASSVNYATANSGCFNTYGGRLPHFFERRLQFDELAVGGAVIEWVGAGGSSANGGQCPVFRTDETSGAAACGTSYDYRCFIPVSSMTSTVLGDSNGIDVPTLASAPGTPDEGQMYYNTTDDKLYVWDGSAWKEVGSGGISSEVSFRAHRNTSNQTIPASTDTLVDWTTEDFDSNNNFDPATERFTPTVAGKYLVTFSAYVNSAPTIVRANLYKNGVSFAQDADGASNAMVTAIVDMNGTTDYIEAYVNSTGTALNGVSSLTYFTGSLISGGTTLGDSNGIDVPTLASAPGTPDEGQMYYNTTDDKLYVWDGSAWKEVGSGSASGTNSPVGFRVTNTTQNILTGTTSDINFTTTIENNLIDGTLGGSVYTVGASEAGAWVLTANFFTAAGIANSNVVYIKKNGVNVSIGGGGGGTSVNARAATSIVLELAAGDTVGYAGFQSSGSTQTVGPPTYLSGYRLGGGSTLGDSNGIDVPTLASAPGTPDEGQMYYNTTDDKLYVWDGSAWKEVGSGAGGGGSIANIQTFTSSGTYTPTAGISGALVIVTGGGGGGGGADNTDTTSFAAGGGGGGGETAKGYFTAGTIGASQTITIGSGGASGGNTGTNGGAGGTTSFGSLLTAVGGSGGVGIQTGTPADGRGGAGGTGGTGGDIRLTGGEGDSGSYGYAVGDGSTRGDGGAGGSSYWGAGGASSGTPANGAVEAGRAATTYGGGGGGAAATNITAGAIGGAGAAGIVVVYEYSGGGIDSEGIDVPTLASAPGTPDEGQMYYNTTDDKLYVWDGAAWQEVGSGAGGSAGPHFMAHRNGTDQTGLTASDILVDYTTEDFDSNNNFDPSTDRFTPTVAGKYHIRAQAGCSGNSSGWCRIRIRKNGSTISQAQINGGGASPTVKTAIVVDMNGTTDYLDVTLRSSDGGTMSGTKSSSFFTGYMIGGGSTLGDSNGIDVPTLASAPGTPDEGQMYYNTTDDKLYVWDGAAWKEVGSGGSGSSVGFTLQGSTQSIPDDSVTKVSTWSTTTTADLGDSTYASGEVTIGTQDAGYWVFTGGLNFTSITDRVRAFIAVNGATVAESSENYTSNVGHMQQIASRVIKVSSGDVVEFRVWHQTGASNSLEDVATTFFSGAKIAASSTSFGDSDGVDVPTLASAPSSPDEGQVYYNTTDNKLYVWDGAAWQEVGSGSAGGSSQTITTGWPDAIQCTISGNTYTLLHATEQSGGNHAYRHVGTSNDVTFNSSGNYVSNTSFGSSDCVTNTWSIADLYSNDKAFNLVGLSGSASAVHESGFPDVIKCTSSDPSFTSVLYLREYTSSLIKYIDNQDGTGRYLHFNNDGSYNTNAALNTDCTGFSIDQLRANGQAYNIVGGGGGSGGSIADADNDTKVQVEETGDEDIIRFDTAGTERMTISATGAVNMTGALTANSFTGDGSGLTNIGASAIADNSISVADLDFASTNGINVPQLASAPGTPTAGQSYFNTTDNRLYFYDGSDWVAAGGNAGTIGMIAAFPMATCPSGWIAADGSAISRTTYSNLFTSISTMYGPGDGSTTFNLPDYRGQFLRGTDGGAGTDPDAGSRTDRGDGTTGDAVGTKQGGEIQAHDHSVDPPSTSTSTDGVHTHTYWESDNADNQINGSPNTTSANHGGSTENTGSSGSHSHTVDIAAFNSATTGGNETRPTNINVVYCISYTGGATAGEFVADGSTPFTGNIRLNDNWLSNDGGNEGIRIDDDGNVGIGTATPTRRLHVVSTKTDTSGYQHTAYNHLFVRPISNGTGTFRAVENYAIHDSGDSDITNVTGALNYGRKVTGGVASSIYGAYNYGFNEGSSGSVTNSYGSYNLSVTAASSSTTGSIGGSLSHARNLGTTPYVYGAMTYAYHESTGTATSVRGTHSRAYNVSTGTINSAYGVYSYLDNQSTGTMDNAYGFRYSLNNAGGGTVTNSYAFFADDESAEATNAYGLYINGATQHNYLAGNLGLGTNSPDNALHISTDTPTIKLTDTDTSADAHLSASSALGSLYLLADVNDEAASSTIGLGVDGVQVVTISSTSASDVHIDDEDGEAQVRLESGNGFNSIIRLYEDGTNQWSIRNQGSNNRFRILDSDSTQGVYIAQNATSWSSDSDIRLKKDIKNITVLDRLKNYRAVSYSWKADQSGEIRELGVIAQEFFQIFPELVVQGDDSEEVDHDSPGTWGVSYDRMGALALQGLKELDNKCEMSAEQLASIESRVEQNERDIASLRAEFEEENQRLKEENQQLKLYLCEKDPEAPFCQ